MLHESRTDPPQDRTGAPSAGAGVPLFIVFNPGSGSQDKSAARESIEAVLRESGRDHRFVDVPQGDVRAACRDAARLACERGGVLVAAGGDGTLNAAAQAALTAGCVLGVIPQGTFNVFARENGIPLDPDEATRALLQGSPTELLVGAVNEQVFLVNASIGLYPKLLADREEAKQKLGRKQWVAKLAALRTLLHWRSRLKLDIERDGRVERRTVASLFCCGNRLQLEAAGVDEATIVTVEEGALAAISAKPLGLGAKLRLVLDALLGRLAQAAEIDTVTFRSLTIGVRYAKRLRVALDGEVRWMQLPLRFAIQPRRLKVLLPPPAESPK